VLVEPGLIRTAFGDAAGAAIRELPAGDDVYRQFHAEVARLTKEASERGLTARLAGTPDDVAAVIERALTVNRPRARYTVSTSATVFINQRRLLGDRGWDRFLRRSFPSPGEPDPS
jgi:hypothetical protein